MVGTVSGIVFGYLLIGVIFASFIRDIANNEIIIEEHDDIDIRKIDENSLSGFRLFLIRHPNIEFFVLVVLWIKYIKVRIN